MTNPSDLLLQVWREACRHSQIDEFTSIVGKMLLKRMSLDGILIRTVDLTKSRIQTVGMAVGKSGQSVMEQISQVPLLHKQKLEDWLKTKKIIHKKKIRGVPAGLSVIFPAGLEGNIFAAPLFSEGSLHGIVIIYTTTSRLLVEHKMILEDLLEPFSAVLNNHQRLARIQNLKEVVEADRDSLLTRLGRSEIGDVIIGAKKGLKTVMERVDLIATSNMPVLIFGETGAGKEVVARAIHQQSDRIKKPFIRVNCGAIPSELIDSELFGHDRGSFTGAVDTRKGWFERADGGTLFLDEVGELSLAAQVRLLRVLQDGTFERVGGTTVMNVDVRIVAATHRNLPKMISENCFREDLWYRLAVFPVYLPPLRERKEDIPDLALHFAQKAAQKFGLSFRSPDDVSMNRLLRYEWPGNVRELATVIERAVILGKGERLDVDTALGIQPGSENMSGQETNGLYQTGSTGGFPTLDEIMKIHIIKALEMCKGRVEGPFGIAELLDVNPHTLRARMRKLGIDWSGFRPG